ncbi:chromosome condensation regulator RCC1 [Vibrio scophthalmi]|uniref:chromosome condensation regulator RCC1 n=1 Tax=Vibrio scophthalmi TaxID=45658 RepID=UPI003EB9153C
MSSLKKSTGIVVAGVAVGLLCVAYWKYHTLVMSIAFEDPKFQACVLEAGNEIAEIEHLTCDYNITSLVGIEHLTELSTLVLHDSELAVADLSQNQYINGFSATNTKLAKLIFAEDNYLYSLEINNSELSDVDISKLKRLDSVEISNSQLNSVDFSNNSALKQIKLNDNRLKEIKGLSSLPVTKLEVAGNQLNHLDVSKLTDLEFLDIENNNLNSIDISANKNLVNLRTTGNDIASLNLEHSNVKLKNVTFSHPTKLKLKGYEWVKDVPFEDENFKQCILDSGHEKVAKVVELACTSKKIKSIAGIEYLQNLKKINVYANYIQEADLRANKLIDFTATRNAIRDVKFGWNPELKTLQLAGNLLEEIDFSGVENIEYMVMWGNKFKHVDINNLHSLETVYLGDNFLTEIDVSNLMVLKKLFVNDNRLSEIDVSKNINLIVLVVRNNNMRYLNLKNNKKLAKDEVGVDQFVRVIR